LNPFDVTAAPAQQVPVVVSTMVFVSVTVPIDTSMAAPVVALFSANVTFVSVAVPARPKRPPPTAAPLPLKVQFVIVAVAALSSPPPDPPWAVFVLTVTRVSVREPATFAIAPPLVAPLPSMVRSFSVAVPPFLSAPPVVVTPIDAAVLPRISAKSDPSTMSVAPALLKMPPPSPVAVLLVMDAKPTFAAPALLNRPAPRAAVLPSSRKSLTNVGPLL
jgi:hypothetical protein